MTMNGKNWKDSVSAVAGFGLLLDDCPQSGFYTNCSSCPISSSIMNASSSSTVVVGAEGNWSITVQSRLPFSMNGWWWEPTASGAAASEWLSLEVADGASSAVYIQDIDCGTWHLVGTTGTLLTWGGTILYGSSPRPPSQIRGSRKMYALQVIPV